MQNYGSISLESICSEWQKGLNDVKAGGVLWTNMIHVYSHDSEYMDAKDDCMRGAGGCEYNDGIPVEQLEPSMLHSKKTKSCK